MILIIIIIFFNYITFIFKTTEEKLLCQLKIRPNVRQL